MKKNQPTQTKRSYSISPIAAALIAASLLTPWSQASAGAKVSAKKSQPAGSVGVQSQVTGATTGTQTKNVHAGGVPTGISDPSKPRGSQGSATQVQTTSVAVKNVSQEVASAGTFDQLWSTSPLAITINRGLAGLAEEVIPSLADPDEFDFADVYFLKNAALSCFVADVGVKDMHLSAPVNSQTVSGYFGNEGKVFSTVDLDASFDATFFWDLEAGDGVLCDIVSAIDNAADFVVGLFGGDSSGSQTANDISYEELTLTAAGLEAEFDFTLALSGSRLSIADISKLTAEIGSLQYDGTALVEGLAILAEDVINLVAGDVTDVVNTVVNEELLPEQESRVQSLVNDALEQNLFMQNSVQLGEFDATIGVEASVLKSSRSANTMTMEFAVELTSDVATASCAEDLSFSSLSVGSAPSTTADFDIQIPHWLVAKIIHEAGRQGLFCHNTLLPFSTDPWTMRPQGALTVANARFTEVITSSQGYSMSVVHHPGELVVTVPVVFTGDGLTYFGSASADLQVYFKPVIPAGNRKVYMSVTEIDLVNVVAGLTLSSGAVVDMSGIVDDVLNTSADILQEKLGNIPLVPKTTSFTEDLAIELKLVSINDAYTTVGVNIVDAPVTNTNSGGSSSGSDWTPGGTNEFRPLNEDEIPVIEVQTLDRLEPLP
jgi:hypothetical protein